MRTATIALAVAIVSGAIASAGEPAWTTVDNQHFSFSLPEAFKKTDARGEDSFVEEYVGDRMKVGFDYGGFSNNFGDWPKDTKYDDLKIDGRSARIGTASMESHKGYPLSTQVHVKLPNGAALSMFAACKSQQEVAIARKIFESLRFKSAPD